MWWIVGVWEKMREWLYQGDTIFAEPRAITISMVVIGIVIVFGLSLGISQMEVAQVGYVPEYALPPYQQVMPRLLPNKPQEWAEQTIKEWSKVVERYPDHIDGHYRLGLAYDLLGQHSEAIEEYQSAIKLRPGYANAHYGLARSYWMQGEYEKSYQELQNTLQINPNHKLAQEWLPLAEEKVKKKEELNRLDKVSNTNIRMP